MTLSYKIKTIKYGTLTMLIDESSLPAIEALPPNKNGNKLMVSYYKNNKAPEPTVTDKGTFEGTFYVFTKDKVAIHRLITNCPDDMLVDHVNHNTLDNRLCNLKVCTAKENRKNNLRAFNDTRKLSKEQIKQILVNEEKLTYNQLADKYGVSNCLISAIRRGTMYTDVEPELPRIVHRTLEYIPLKVKKWIKMGLASGVSIPEISKELGIPKSRLYQVRKGKIWKNI